MTITKAQAHFIAAIVASLLIGAGLLAAGLWIDKARKAITQNQMRGEVAEATAGNIATVAKADAEATATVDNTTQAATVYRQSKEEEERREPTARARNNAPVPDSVRQRASARRIARERSARDAGGSAEVHQADAATQR